MQPPTLRDVQIAISSRDVPEYECQVSISSAIAAGAACINPVRGCPGLALARNRALTNALRASKRDFILTLDDDVSFTVAQLEQLLALAAQCGRPVAAAYPNAAGHFQYLPVGDKFATGLGFVIFPRRVLEDYAQTVELIEWTDGQTVWAFTQEAPLTHPHTGRRHWGFDDYWLAYALGGFDLSPIVVRHVKKNGLTFDPEHLQHLINPPKPEPEKPEPEKE